MVRNLPVALDLAGGQSLSGYIQAVNAIPMLTAEQERELAVRYRRDDDIDAARELVLSHLRHVVRVARGFMGYGLPLADLIQEGNIGLMKAVKRFDPERDVRLVSFAVHWIRAEIYDFVLRNWRIVKVATTKSQRKLFFNLRKSRARLGWMREDEVGDLARDLDVDPDTVRQMESRLTSTDVPFDGGVDDIDGSAVAPASYLADNRYNPERLLGESMAETARKEQVGSALQALDERSRDIVARRWLSESGEKPTLHELADEYGVSAERIRQIEKRALERMKVTLMA